MGDTRSARRRDPVTSFLPGPLRRVLPPALQGLLAFLVLWVVSGCGDGRPPDSDLPGAVFDPPRPAPALRLTGADGAYDLAADRGRVALVFFGFTNCPDICPTTLDRWTEVRRLLGPAADGVRFVFVSVDAKRDTPAIAAAYAAGFDAAFVGLSGTEAEVRQAALAWGIATERREGEGDSTGEPDVDIVHASQVFVVDPEGRLRWAYGRSVPAERIAAGIRSLGAAGP
jgi:protein SCO1/2